VALEEVWLEKYRPVDLDEARDYLRKLWHDGIPLKGLGARDALARLHSPPVRSFLHAATREQTLDPDQHAAIDVPGLVAWGRLDTLLDGRTPALLARAGHMVHQDRLATVRRHLLHLAREGG
jgi:hypothetical protein